MAKLTVDELKTELKSIGFTDEQLTGMTKSSLESLANGYMRQSDYDREMNANKAELQKAQDALTDARSRLDAEMVEWGQLKNNDAATIAAQRDRLEKAEAKVLSLTQRVTRIATDAGLDPTKALEGIEQPPAPPPAPVGPDPSKFVSTDDYRRAQSELAGMMLRWPSILMKLDQEHQSLFDNKHVDGDAIIDEINKRAGTRGNQKSLDPRTVWEELNNVGARREAIAAKEREDFGKSQYEAGMLAGRSERLTPGSTNAPGVHAPIFGKPRESVLQRPQPGTTVSTAAAAFRTGKYKTGAGAGRT